MPAIKQYNNLDALSQPVNQDKSAPSLRNAPSLRGPELTCSHSEQPEDNDGAFDQTEAAFYTGLKVCVKDVGAICLLTAVIVAIPIWVLLALLMSGALHLIKVYDDYPHRRVSNSLAGMRPVED